MTFETLKAHGQLVSPRKFATRPCSICRASVGFVYIDGNLFF